MSGTPQKLTGHGKTPPIEAAGSGNERRVVDPELRDLLGNVIAPRTIAVSDGFEVASIQDDPNLALFGTFTVQNRLSVEAQCKWEASHLHSIQKAVNETEEGSFGTNGGGVEPPLAFADEGEANTASNLGGGAGLFASKVGADLQFKSLTAGAGITLVPSPTEIQVVNSSTGYAGPQTPDTTGAFAHYPLQSAFGATTFTDTIGGRTITRTGIGAFIEVPHPIFPSRKLVYVTTAIWESAVDAAWASVGQTVEMLVLPFNTGTNPVMRIINNGGQETFRIHWSNGRWQYTHFSQNVLTPLNNPNFSGFGGARQYPEVYLLRVERDDAIKEVRFYVDGKLWNTIVYGTGLPAGGGEKIQMDVMGVMYSDMTIWNTATPPVTALQQAQRVKPWLF